ncbi:pleiotropic drug resistance protein 2-like protein [Tanacetum coccineum]
MNYTPTVAEAVLASHQDLRRNNDMMMETGGGKQSRSEKKSHKAMFKLGMKAILGVSRVTIKRTKYISYEYSEVIMNSGTDWVKPSLGWTDSFVLLYWRGGGWDTTYVQVLVHISVLLLPLNQIFSILQESYRSLASLDVSESLSSNAPLKDYYGADAMVNKVATSEDVAVGFAAIFTVRGGDSNDEMMVVVHKTSFKMFVEEFMNLLELNSMRNARVGIPGINGLSTEHHKRLTIAVELVVNPSIIFMAKPTSGLDARVAAIVMRTVRNTVDTGAGKSLMLDLLDTNMLDISSSAVEAQLSVDFTEIYANSDLYRRNQELIKELSTPAQGSYDLHFPTKYSQSFWTRCLASIVEGGAAQYSVQAVNKWDGNDQNLAQVIQKRLTTILILWFPVMNNSNAFRKSLRATYEELAQKIDDFVELRLQEERKGMCGKLHISFSGGSGEVR